MSPAFSHLEGISDEKVFLFSRSWVPNPWQAAFLAFPQDQPAVLNLEEKMYFQQSGVNGLAIRYLTLERPQNRNIFKLRGWGSRRLPISQTLRRDK